MNELAGARSSVENGDWAAAVDAYEHAMSGDWGPEDHWLYATALFELERDDEAREQFQLADRPAARSDEARVRFADALASWAEHELAAPLYERAARTIADSSAAAALYGLAGDECAAAEDHHGAIRNYLARLATVPHDAETMTAVAKSYDHLGETVAAIEWYSKALATDPAWFEAAHGLANLLDDEGRKEEAAALYQQALRDSRDDDDDFADLLYDYGLHLKRQGLTREATHWLVRALAVDPDHELARRDLEELTEEP